MVEAQDPEGLQKKAAMLGRREIGFSVTIARKGNHVSEVYGSMAVGAPSYRLCRCAD